MGIDIRFTDDDWSRIERDWRAWWAGDLDRAMVMVERVGAREGRAHPKGMPRTNEFMLNSPVDEFLDIYQEQLESTVWYGDAFPRVWLNFGPGIVSGFLGGQVEFDNNTTWFGPGKDTALEAIRPTFDPNNVWWRRIVAITQRAVERWRGQVCVSHTDLGGNLDIIASLRETQPLLMDLLDSPQQVDRLVRQVTQCWLRYYDELYQIIKTGGRGTTPWAPIWSPKRTYMTQCDFSYMISPAMFERFVIPDLAACCDAMEHCFYHLDGPGQIPHVDLLLSLEKLRGIQWICGDGHGPTEKWLTLLKRIIDGGKLCQLFVSPEGARTIVRELGGRGFALFTRAEGLSDAQVRQLVDDLGAG